MLRSSHTPNWLQQLCIVPNVEHRDAIIAATMEGDAKLWLLPVSKVVVYQVSNQHTHELLLWGQMPSFLIVKYSWGRQLPFTFKSPFLKYMNSIIIMLKQVQEMDKEEGIGGIY